MATCYRREALTLYRDILRTCRLFRNVPHPSGVPQSVIIHQSARKEFEDGRKELDGEMQLKLIMGGRSALEEVQNRVLQKFTPGNPPNGSS